MRRKMKKIGILAGFVVLVAGSALVDSSLAALISIDNQSFEVPSGVGRDGQSLYTTTASATLYDWTFTQTGAATQLAAVPEPGTLGMLVAGLIGLPGQASRKRRYWLATGH